MATKAFNASLNPADWPEKPSERAAYLERLLHKVICVGCDTTPRCVWMGMLTGESNYGLKCDCWPELPKPVQQIYHVDERRWNMVQKEIARRPNDLPAITKQDVKQHLASKATDGELELFVRFCISQELNPFAREAHLVKIEGQPAYIQVDYKVLFRLAHRDPDYLRYSSGVTILVDDNLERRTGSLVLPSEQLVGGWCKIWMKGHEEPIEEEVSFAEFNTGQSVWKKKPGFMIEKVAITTNFRRAVRGIEDLMGAAVAMRVEAAEVEVAVPDAIEAPAGEMSEEEDPTAGLYEPASAPESHAEPVSADVGSEEPTDAPLFPPEPSQSRHFADAGAFRKALKDDFALASTADVNEALDQAGLGPLAELGNLDEAYAAITAHREQPIETDQ